MIICLENYTVTISLLKGVCCIVEHHFPHFTHQSGITRHFPTVFDSFSHFPTFSDSFWQFFTDFSTFRHFFRLRCAPAQNRDAYHKNVRWTAKRREIREKLSKTVGKCRVAPDWYVKCGKRCSTIQQVQNQFLFLIFNFNFNF